MDKFEYKVRADEIKELIAKGEYPQAAEIADTIDWRRVKNVMMLCTISDLYKINRRYEDARDMLYLAYERRPGGKSICYSLCELCIKTEEFVEAVNFYKEFVMVAPKDPARYILQYKIYEAQDVSLEERIGILEELKKRDYREKWAYELAYLYHRVGLATRCVEECDELILWFGEGKYVIKAMELKMLHEPLTDSQQEKYNRRYIKQETQVAEQPVMQNESADGETVNPDYQTEASQSEQGFEGPIEDKESKSSDEMDIQVKTVDVGEFNTINLQEEIAAGVKEYLSDNTKHQAITDSILAPMLESDTETLDLPEINEVDENDVEPVQEIMEGSEVFFGETADMGRVPESIEPESVEPESVEPEEAEVKIEALPETLVDITAETVMQEIRNGEAAKKDEMIQQEPPKALARVLSQEDDGQIRLVVPENETVEKQITGQMSIEDILLEWERMKKENEEKRKEDVRQHVLQQTGAMFTEFETAVRDGLLEQLEKGEQIHPDSLTGAPQEETQEKAVSTGDYDFETEPLEEIEEVTDENIGESFEEQDGEVTEENLQEPEEGMEETFEEQDEEVTEETLQEPEEGMEETFQGQDEKVTEEILQGSEEGMEETFEEQDEEVTGESLQEPEEGMEETFQEQDEEVTEEILQEAEPAEDPFEEQEEEIREASNAVTQEAPSPIETEKAKVRAMTKEERELYAPFIQSRAGRDKLVRAIDEISLAAYTGNVIITGEEGMDTMTLAKNIIREIQMTDSNFSGKVAKISGKGLNSKNIESTVDKLNNGALIVQKASDINEETVAEIYRNLQQESKGIIFVLEDTKQGINKLLQTYPQLKESFTARIDIEAMSNDALAEAARVYARELEYSIDDLGILALHTRIEELQTIDHSVSVKEVREIVDEAINHVNRKTLGHFFDILLGKRYDEEDMIVLTEKDFS